MLAELFAPFESWNEVLVWYLWTLALQVVIAAGYVAIGFKPERVIAKTVEKLGVSRAALIIVGAGPILEELIFRGIPYFLFGSTVALIIGSIIWTALHGPRALAIAPAIPLYVKLWAAGMVDGAILVHVAHNGIFFAIGVLAMEVKGHVNRKKPA